MRFSFKKALASVLSFALILTAFTGVLTTNAVEPVNKGTLTLSDVSVDANAGSFDVVADIVLTEASEFATVAFQLGGLPEGVALDSASVDSAVGTVTVDAAKNLVVFEGEQNAVANISITLGFTMTGVDSSFAISVVKVEYADATEGDYVLDYTDTAAVTVNQIHGPAAEWSYDDTNHYHACTAEGCDEQFDAAPHELTVQETPSDCDTAGSKVSTCSVCGYSRTEVIDPTGHTPVVDPAVAATCTSTGLTEGSHCSVCGATIVAQEVVPMLPHTEGTPVDNGDGTHTVSCTVCGEPIRTEAHNYVDGECACGAVEEVPVVKFDMYGSNMTMGSSLLFNFFVNQTDVTDTESYAVITKKYADGREDAKVTIPYSEWETYSNNRYWKISFSGIAAKEANDLMFIEIFNSKDQLLTNEYSDSITSYAVRLFNAPTSDELTKTAAVDLLYYCSGAQEEFEYDIDNLAEAAITDEMKPYATDASEATSVNKQVKGDNFYGTVLSLEDKIIMKMFFNGVDKDTMYAKITYTDFRGREQTYTVDGEDFVQYNRTNYYGPQVDTLVFGDGYQLVTCEIFNEDGSLYGSCQDSIESAVARLCTAYPDNTFYPNLMKIVVSMKNYSLK